MRTSERPTTSSTTPWATPAGSAWRPSRCCSCRSQGCFGSPTERPASRSASRSGSWAWPSPCSATSSRRLTRPSPSTCSSAWRRHPPSPDCPWRPGMRVLLVHNYYQRPGGEDQSFAANAALLEERGHEVIRFTLHNDAVEEMGRVATARAAVWNADVHRSLRELVRYRRPEIAHFENTFPLISPAAYYAAQAERSEEHTSELQSLMRISYAVFCLKNKQNKPNTQHPTRRYKI